jgi:hypothetical protein
VAELEAVDPDARLGVDAHEEERPAAASLCIRDDLRKLAFIVIYYTRAREAPPLVAAGPKW